MRTRPVESAVRIAALSAALLAAACASPLPEEDLARRLNLVGHSVLGSNARFTRVAIQAENQMMAWALQGEARANGPSDQSRWLYGRFAEATQRRVNVVVGGPYPSLTHQVVLDAFSLNESRPLRGLTLVLVGGDEAPKDVRSAAERVGARFVHRALP